MSAIIDIFLFSIVISFLLVLCNKILIPQDKAKEIKSRIQELGEKMKTDKENKNIFSEVMKENHNLMKLSMRSMLLSMVVVILLIGHISSVYGDKTIDVAGAKVEIDGSLHDIRNDQNVITIDGKNCNMPCEEKIGSSFWTIHNTGNNIKLERITAKLPVALPIVGTDLSWLWWYFITYLPFFYLFRKLMKVYI